MNYHVNRQGRDLGTFSLEEIRRRRLAGEFDGTENVWREGMQQWEALDAVLEKTTSSTVTPPPIPLLPQKKSRRKLVWATVIGVLLAVVGIVTFGLAILKVVREVRTASNGGRAGEDQTAASKPISPKGKTLTQADVQNRGRAFRVRQWLDGYKERGQRNNPCDAEMIRFIEAWLGERYGADEPEETTAASALGDHIVESTGCDDPLILTLAGVTSVEVHESVRRLERAVKGFESSKHRAYPRFYAVISLAHHVTDERDRLATLDKTAIQLFTEAFADGSFTPGDQAEIAEILVFGWGRSFFYRHGARLSAIAQESGKDYAWLALALDGEYHINEAWRARGGGYSDSVTEKGWQGFSTASAAARTSLTSAWKLRPDLPLAPSRMIYVSLGDSGIEEMRLWFDRAITAQIDYPDAWTQMRWGLRPRWYGTPQSMLALGLAAAKTKRFDTDLPRKLMDIVGDLESEEGIQRGEHIYGRPDIWPHLQAMYEGYLAEPSQAAARDGWRGSYAIVAYLARRYDVAAKQLAALNWELQTGKLSGWGADLSLMPLEVAARTSSEGGRIATAEESFARADVNQALSQYKKLSQDTKLDPRTTKFVQHRIAILEFENRLKSGNWEDFAPGDTFDLLWAELYGKSKALHDGGVEVESGKRGHMLFCRARLGPEFEIKGDFEVVRSSNKSFQAGLVMGNPDPAANAWYAFRMKRNDVEGELVSFSNGWTRQQFYRSEKLRDDHNSFDFRFRTGRATAYLNGERALQNARTPRNIALDNAHIYAGLGAFNDMNDTVIRYRNLQVRKLVAQSAEAK